MPRGWARNCPGVRHCLKRCAILQVVGGTVKHHLHPGDRFGKLTVIETGHRVRRTPRQIRLGIPGNRACRVRCSCGSDRDQLVSIYNLINGNTQSCGCKHRETMAALAYARQAEHQAAQAKAIAWIEAHPPPPPAPKPAPPVPRYTSEDRIAWHLTRQPQVGDVFGLLTVVANGIRVPFARGTRPACEVACQCGSAPYVVATSYLREGSARSCGCGKLASALLRGNPRAHEIAQVMCPPVGAPSGLDRHIRHRWIIKCHQDDSLYAFTATPHQNVATATVCTCAEHDPLHAWVVVVRSDLPAEEAVFEWAVPCRCGRAWSLTVYDRLSGEHFDAHVIPRAPQTRPVSLMAGATRA